MLSCTVDEGSLGQQITLCSADTDIVEVDTNGYVAAVGVGETSVTAKLASGAHARIRIIVVVPVLEEKSFLRGGVNIDSHCSLRLELSDDTPISELVYVEARKDGKLVGRTTETLKGNRLLFVPLAALGVAESGVYEFGAAICRENGIGRVLSIAASDGLQEYTLAKDEPWSMSNAEIRTDGTLSIVNVGLNHGGASVTFDVSDYQKGSGATHNIRVRAASGVMWAAKLRRGDGVNDLYEEVVLNDVSVFEVSELSIPLSAYEKYIRGGKITLVIYAVGGDLKMDLIRYGTQGGYDLPAVSGANYVPIQTVTAVAPSFVEKGEEYTVEVQCSPRNATWKDFSFYCDSENIEIVKTDLTTAKFIVRENGKYTITVQGVTADIKTTFNVIAGVSAAELTGEGMLSYAIVDKATGRFDFGARLSLLPENTTQTAISYAIMETTSAGASVDDQGTVSFTNAGTVKLKAWVTENAAVYKTFELRVEDGVTESGSVTVSAQKTAVKTGESTVLTATLTPASATYNRIVWQSSAPEVFSVDESGNVTALTGGRAIIYAIAGDGLSYGKIILTSQATAKLAIDPNMHEYALLVLDSNTQAGDRATIGVFLNGERVKTLEYTVPEAEKDGAALGLLEAQRRILLSTAGLQAGEYEFVLTVRRGEENAAAFGFEELTTIAVGKDMLNAEWQGGYQAAAIQTENGVALTLKGDYGYICAAVDRAEIGNELVITTAQLDTVEKISIKLRFGETEIALTAGDMTSRGVWRIDLNATVGEQLASCESFELLLYGIGESGDEITFEKIFFTPPTTNEMIDQNEIQTR